MNNIITKENIENLIYEVRGKQVMLDSDVARLYKSETKVINQVVKRNINRFPESFCFRLTKEEHDFLRSHFVTLNTYGRGQHVKYLPYVFTEHGIMMLSGLLKSDIAAEVNKNIIEAFIAMQKYIGDKEICNLLIKKTNEIIK